VSSGYAACAPACPYKSSKRNQRAASRRALACAASAGVPTLALALRASVFSLDWRRVEGPSRFRSSEHNTLPETPGTVPASKILPFVFSRLDGGGRESNPIPPKTLADGARLSSYLVGNSLPSREFVVLWCALQCSGVLPCLGDIFTEACEAQTIQRYPRRWRVWPAVCRVHQNRRLNARKEARPQGRPRSKAHPALGPPCNAAPCAVY